jgi:cytochrome c oxidase cbb3-type subunit III
MPGWKLDRCSRLPLTAAALLTLSTLPCFAQQHIETSTFNQAPGRPQEDAKQVAKGKQVYEKQCASCHATDMRGVENAGPNLLRSQAALIDKHGEDLVPIMQGMFPDFPGHRYDISKGDAESVAAYVRSLLAQIGSQGRPPGESERSPNVLVGDASAGKVYFEANCAKCHSAEGDLKGIGGRVSSPKTLQGNWLRGTHLGAKLPPTIVTVTEPGKPMIEGTLIHIDDFLLTLQMPDASMQTIRRRGALPKVVIKDPLQAHRELLPTYTDKDIHDVTAYLVTLK